MLLYYQWSKRICNAPAALKHIALRCAGLAGLLSALLLWDCRAVLLPSARPSCTSLGCPGLPLDETHPSSSAGSAGSRPRGWSSSQEPGSLWCSDVHAAQACVSCGNQGIPGICCPALFPLFNSHRKHSCSAGREAGYKDEAAAASSVCASPCSCGAQLHWCSAATSSGEDT